jgi:hypothetical protein
LAGVGEAVREFRMKIPHGVSAASVRQAVKSVLVAWDVSDHSDVVLLVTTELVQNVTQHTVDGGEFRLALHPGMVLVEVRDGNVQPPVQGAPDPRDLGGRGLMIVAAVARRWGYRPMSDGGCPGKVVWAELALNPVG